MCVQVCVCVCISSGLALLVFLAFPAPRPQLANSAIANLRKANNNCHAHCTIYICAPSFSLLFSRSLSHLNAFREIACQSNIFLWHFVIRGPSSNFGQLYEQQHNWRDYLTCSQSNGLFSHLLLLGSARKLH